MDKKQTTKERYDECMEGEVENDPVERLRFFLSIALVNQDWLDVELFLDDVKAAISEEQ